MSEKMVLVPQRMLDKLEESRQALYGKFDAEKIFPDKTANFSLLEMIDITDTMWELSHRKFEEFKP